MKLNKYHVSALLMALVFILVFTLTQCAQDKNNEQDSTTTTTVNQSVQDTQPPPLLSGDEVMTCKKEGNLLQIGIDLPSGAGCEASLIAISDPEYRFGWSDNPETVLSDIAQITLDGDGKGSVTLVLKAENAKAYVILTCSDNSYMIEIA